ncbi:hypothetical protein GCM10025857_05900 [Alicyclobacillus contaminans]|uniref:hypothetical protein n=1 Tax=Alicyclobacillus contaminans TaxID=392016 RepID=UPI00040904FC|nr:hypothetical protein [Alicyclobacillus contaminans]GMA49233.1 hypothetical protein GCM10025857_05900 [Alicyclobacillus contaminans]
MLAILWLSTGAVLILTMLAAFAIPSWPLLAVFLLACGATIGYRFTRRQAVPMTALAGTLCLCAYDVVRLIEVVNVAH